MLQVLVTICIIFLILVLTLQFRKAQVRLDYSFMSRYHTDALKGIAAILVVIAHVGSGTGTRYFTPLGGIGVALFLICSGLGLYRSYVQNGLQNFFMKRFSRVLVPYWLVVVALNLMHMTDFSISGFMKSLVLLPTYSYWWFVQFIAVQYVLFYFAFKYFRENFRIPVIAVLSAIFFLVTPNDLWAEQSFSFLVGLLYGKYEKANFSVGKAWLIGCCSLSLGIVALVMKQVPAVRSSFYLVFNSTQVTLKLATAIGIIYLTYVLLKAPITKALAVAGPVSYEIYLVHTLLIFIITNSFTMANVITFVLVCSLAIYLFSLVNNALLRQVNVASRISLKS